MLRRIGSPARRPLLVLALVSMLSLGARADRLGEPCQSPCTVAADHTLIFDEAYYVNAARVIDGIRPAAGSHYDGSPLGTDPNAEHPQGAKLVMAAAIRLFGDGPFAWRIGSLLFGSLAILGMYALVRFAGGRAWTAVGAATLMACDNLLLVHGRIGTLDIYAVALMVWGVAFYVRGSPGWAALGLGLADCFKEVAPYALFVIGLVELGRIGVRRHAGRRGVGSPESWAAGPALRRLAVAAIGSAAVFVVGLWVMGLIATPYADSAHDLITGGPFDHLWHMVTYAAALTSPHGATGIASYPWQWLIDLKPITYLRINPSLPGAGLDAVHPVSAFLGMMSPPIIAFAVPAMVAAMWRALRRRPPPAATASGEVASAASGIGELGPAILGVAWFLGTWLPYQLQSALDSRTSYLYYMVIVMPGIYVALADASGAGWRTGARWLQVAIVLWSLTVLAAVILMYPFVTAF